MGNAIYGNIGAQPPRVPSVVRRTTPADLTNSREECEQLTIMEYTFRGATDAAAASSRATIVGAAQLGALMGTLDGVLAAQENCLHKPMQTGK